MTESNLTASLRVRAEQMCDLPATETLSTQLMDALASLEAVPVHDCPGPCGERHVDIGGDCELCADCPYCKNKAKDDRDHMNTDAEAARRLEARVAHGREQTARADTKSQIVAAGAAAVATATIATGALTGLSLAAAIPAWVAVVALVAAVTTLGVVLWPRAPRAYRPNVDLILAHARVDGDTYAADLASEAMAIEEIRDVKFRLLRIALGLLAAAGIFAGVAAIVAALV